MRKLSLFEKIILPTIGVIVAIVIPLYIYSKEEIIVDLKMVKFTTNDFSVLGQVGKKASNAKVEIIMNDRKVEGMYFNLGCD